VWIYCYYVSGSIPCPLCRIGPSWTPVCLEGIGFWSRTNRLRADRDRWLR
jgi:hypothetical protein